MPFSYRVGEKSLRGKVMDGDQRCIKACCLVKRRVLSPPPKHGPMVLIMKVLGAVPIL